MSSDVPEESETSSTPVGVIVIAAGRGTRMKSNLNKVLHPILGIPVISHVLRAVTPLEPRQIVVVTGVDGEEIRSRLSGEVSFAVQPLPIGTADAVAVGLNVLSPGIDRVLVLNGDVPLIVPADVLGLLSAHLSQQATATIATFPADPTSSYGRLLRKDELVTGLIEAKDDNRTGLPIIEANGGVYVFKRAWLEDTIGNVPVSASGEYYLTSLIGMAARNKDGTTRIATVEIEPNHLIGVDDRVRLAEAEDIMRRRVLRSLMESGVTITDPGRTIVEPDVQIGPDARIEPGSIIRGFSRVGARTTIGPYSIIEDSTVGADCVLRHSWVTDSVVEDGVHLGPYSHLRPGTEISSGVHIGNFVETKAASIGAGTRIGHFSYVGDARVGRNVNIGAGTITCNFDGLTKHRTVIGDDVFVGSDTMLVAPVELGEGSRTGAGSVVTRSVPPGKTVVGVPARQAVAGKPRLSQRENEEHGR